MLRQGHPATPHHREGERDPATDHQVGGVLGDKTTPRRERSRPSGDPKGGRGSGYAIPDLGPLAMRYQTWGTTTPHREGGRGRGSGFAIPDWGLSPGPEGDKRGTHHGGVAGDHEVDP